MTLIRARDSRFLHLPAPSSLLRFIRGTPRQQRRRSEGIVYNLELGGDSALWPAAGRRVTMASLTRKVFADGTR